MGSPYRGSLAGTAGQQGAADLIPDNGIAERFNKTMLDEFYRVAFRKKLCATIDGLQADLDDWVKNYSEERPHQDRRLSNPSGGPDQTLDAVRQIKFQLLQSNSKA